MDDREFEARGNEILAWITRYWRGLDARPVREAVAPGAVFHALPASAPETGDDPCATLTRELDALIAPALTHWQHPSFFAYFPANASAPAILGDLVSAGLGVQGMLWATSPACTELEMRVLDWLARALGLPDAMTHEARLAGRGHGGGVIHSTASEAVLVALVAARARQRTRAHADGAHAPLRDEDPEPHYAVYASAEAHASVVKAAMIAGLARDARDPRHVRLIPVDAQGRMCPRALADALARDRARSIRPTLVVATLGTTGIGAVDDLDAIAGVLARECDGDTTGVPRPWLHVDGAWGVSACVCPEARWMLGAGGEAGGGAGSAGLARVDSLCVNPHKWLLTNFDCDAFFVRDAREVAGAMAITPEYLKTTRGESGAYDRADVDFRDWQVPLGRRFRALKLWLVLRHYGLAGLREFIRSHIAMAQWLAGEVARDPRFVLAAPVSLSLVCLRLAPRPGEKPEDADARTLALIERVNDSGRALVTRARTPEGLGASTLARDGSPHESGHESGHDSAHEFGHDFGPPGGRVILRVAIGGTRTSDAHVRALWDLLRAST
jgi:aromatic-L-amino-acid decarboxylase